MLGRVLRTVFGVCGWLGVLYAPADLWGICETYPQICRGAASLDRFQVLAVFSFVLVAWSFYRDWREPVEKYRKWLRGKRGLYTIESVEIGHPDGFYEIHRAQAVLRFRKAAKSVTIRLFVRSLIGTSFEHVKLAGEETLSDVQADQTHVVILGILQARNSISGTSIIRSHWGREPSIALPIIGGSKNVLTLSVNGREHRIFVSVPIRSPTDHMVIFDQDEPWIPLLREGIATRTPQ